MEGDFICVQRPSLDGLGGQRGVRSESAAFQTLVRQLHLENSRTLIILVNDVDESLALTSYFIYWGPKSASRIDRFYVPQIMGGGITVLHQTV